MYSSTDGACTGHLTSSLLARSTLHLSVCPYRRLLQLPPPATRAGFAVLFVAAVGAAGALCLPFVTRLQGAAAVLKLLHASGRIQ